MSEQYFTPSPDAAMHERTHSFVIRGVDHRVTTASGVFSADRLDKGTQVLLDHVPDPPGQGTFLDLGCGWGPIALALADAAPRARVLAADVNERALELTARNAAAAGRAGVHVEESSALRSRLEREGARIDLIWSNPPVRIGKEAWLVVNRNLGADSLVRWLADRSWAVSRTASSKGFRVLRVKR